MAALVAVTGAVAGVTAPASAAPGVPIAPQTRPAVFGTPLPADPAPDAPSSDQLMAILNGLANPAVPFANKSNLVEDGISPIEARLADTRMQQAVARGELPLTLNVANIQLAGANRATADVTVSGPKLARNTQNVTFVNQGGWKITHASAISLLQESGSGGS